MINNRKVRLMSRLAIYEKGKGREDVRLGKYFRRDYLRLRILMNLIAVTIGYVILVGMVIGYKVEYIVSEAVHLDYFSIGTKVLAGYLIVLTVYIAITICYNMIYYNSSRKKLAKYFRMLTRLREFYAEEEGQKNEAKEIPAQPEETEK